MLNLRVIPCLDVKDGRVVKGVQFLSLRDAGDPVEQASAYDAAGADAFGSQAVVCAIDAKRTEDGDWRVFIYGGRKDTGLDVVEYAALAVQKGAGEILLTSMDRDGAKTGYDIELLRAVTGAVSVPVIASGGAGSAAHMVEAATQGGADAVLAASIFHFGEVSIGEVKQAMIAAGLPARLTGAEMRRDAAEAFS